VKSFQAGRKEIQASRKEIQASRKEIQIRRKEIQVPFRSQIQTFQWVIAEFGAGFYWEMPNPPAKSSFGRRIHMLDTFSFAVGTPGAQKLQVLIRWLH
jgi:hypothetical protein